MSLDFVQTQEHWLQKVRVDCSTMILLVVATTKRFEEISRVV